MSEFTNTAQAQGPALWRAWLWGGALAAALDLSSAFILSGAPMRVSHAIASGVLGKAAYEGGMGTAALGVFLHFAIVIVAAFIFCQVARRWDFLLQKPLVSGAVCGVIIYLVMNFVVLPLSMIPFKINYTLVKVTQQLLIHIFLIGIVIALVARHFLGNRN